MKKILYWSFEGNEGTGKTTLSKKFAERCSATWTYEPNAETEVLKYLRHLGLNENDSITKYDRENALLANRIIHHHQTVIPLINMKHTVVTDRSFLSGMVYAKLKSYSFQEFFERSEISNVSLFPDAIIYVRNKERRIVKNVGDIYDNAPKEVHDRIDDIYDEALEFLQKNKYTKEIKIIEFDNDFNKTVDANLDSLVKDIKLICHKFN